MTPDDGTTTALGSSVPQRHSRDDAAVLPHRQRVTPSRLERRYERLLRTA